MNRQMLYSQWRGHNTFVYENMIFFIRNVLMVACMGAREKEKEREKEGRTTTIIDSTWRQTYSERYFFFDKSFGREPVLIQKLT